MEIQTDSPNKAAKRTLSWPLAIAIILLVAVAAFVAGTRSDELWTRLSGHGSGNLDTSSLQALYRTLQDKYDGKLDENKLIDGAKHGMVESVGDPYTVYFNAEEKLTFSDELEGRFEGIGAELAKRGDKLIITRTIDGSPAAKAGLRTNDHIVTVNGDSTAKWSVEEAVSKIRGEKGTTVKLGIARAGGEVTDVTITRASVSDPSVHSEVTKDNIGIMRVTRFGNSNTAQLARAAAKEFKDRKVRGVVLDLRGNGGGYLTAAQSLAGLWLENKVVVTEQRAGRVTDTLRSGSSAPLKDIPTIVLINGGSASASEILAGALKDHGAARLVGEKTFGKGVVQDVVDTPDGGSLKVTIAKWYTPSGKNINEEGISPDIKVALSDADFAAGRDPQQAKALELLK